MGDTCQRQAARAAYKWPTAKWAVTAPGLPQAFSNCRDPRAMVQLGARLTRSADVRWHFVQVQHQAVVQALDHRLELSQLRRLRRALVALRGEALAKALLDFEQRERPARRLLAVGGSNCQRVRHRVACGERFDDCCAHDLGKRSAGRSRFPEQAVVESLGRLEAELVAMSFAHERTPRRGVRSSRGFRILARLRVFVGPCGSILVRSRMPELARPSVRRRPGPHRTGLDTTCICN